MSLSRSRLFHRPLGLFAALVALAGGARATWSIVAVDTATGEVCVASATCLANFDLQRWVPVLRVGEGGAAAQSVVDQGATNRTFIWARMAAGFSPRMILAALPSIDPLHQSRQYGMVTLAHEPMTFTGSNAGHARHGVAGTVGTIKYAIQGNLLTGAVVVERAEFELRNSGGDLGQRVMRAMMGARRMGGDGRCSCSASQPTSCGAPPPSFDKSAHVAFIVLARIGDTNGECNVTLGCANGDYYLDLQRITSTSGPDPVLELRDMYADWRATWVGRPDHIRSELELAVDSLPADGLSETTVVLRLVDVDGTPLTSGGAQVELTWSGQGPELLQPGPVADHGDGSYSFTLRAGATPGEASYFVTVDDGLGPVRLHPGIGLRVDPLAELHAGKDEVRVSDGASVPFVLNLTAPDAGRPYLLLGSASGTRPGQPFHGLHLALNHDDFFVLTLTSPGPPTFPGSIGQLDALGRAQASFVASPSELLPFLGGRLDWVAVVGQGAPHATNGVGFDVVP